MAGERPSEPTGFWPRRPYRVYTLQAGLTLGYYVERAWRRFPVFANDPFEIDAEIRHGDSIGALQVVHTPGHTDGSMSFYWPAERALFPGDVPDCLEPLGSVPEPTLFRTPAADGDHGPGPQPVPVPPRFRPRLAGLPLTHAAPYDPQAPATAALHQTVHAALPGSVTCSAPRDKRAANHASGVPNRNRFSRAAACTASSFFIHHSNLVAVASVLIGMPAARKPATRSAVRWSCQLCAGASGASVRASHASAVPRCVTTPSPAIARAPSRDAANASRSTSCALVHISSGSCSIQPGCG